MISDFYPEGDSIMIVLVSTKNFDASDHMISVIEAKLSRLDKYFSKEIETNVMLSTIKGRQKIEATLNANGAIFRAEETTQDIYTGIDRIVDKLSSQMSKFKSRLARRHKDNNAILFSDIPDHPEEEHEGFEIVRRKTHELMPMTPEEAILQMEMLSHNFFVFLDMDRAQASIVYKRDDGKYGLLETTA